MRKVPIKPVSPFHREKGILQRPNHARSSSPTPELFAQTGQLIYSQRDGVFIELLHSILRRDKWLQIHIECFILNTIRIGKYRPQHSFRSPCEILVSGLWNEKLLGEFSALSHFNCWDEILWRIVIVHVAVRQK